ncbi:ATP-binding protein [Candidatus Gracilibacteria bacterium]|nr:ATP-binding protein [Candidatus Gracilibacteria bacterium]
MKLIILNGAPGVGKSTVAEKLHAELPLSFLIVIDAWWKQISNWRESRKESQRLVYKIASVSIDAYLEEGKDVIVDKAILNDIKTLDELVGVGEKHGAEVYELVLMASKEVVLERATQRGFNKQGLLTPEEAEKLWELSQDLKETRPNAVVIDTTFLSPEEVYEKVRGVVL